MQRIARPPLSSRFSPAARALLAGGLWAALAVPLGGLPWTAGAMLWGTASLAAQQVGPSKGALVIVGGAMEDSAIVRAFIDLAGGRRSRIVVIPTAGEGDDYDEFYPGLEQFRGMGARHLDILHTRDRRAAQSEEFVQALQEATGVWISGGRQWRLADVYGGTRTEEEIKAVLDRGGVVGGSSAGASILASFLIRGDTRTNAVVVGQYQKGFGFLRNTAIDQHLLTRNRQFDLVEVIRDRPELLGIGIDENTAIVVKGDLFEVVGKGYVAIYDHGHMLENGGQFYFLAPGDRFALAEREPVRTSRTGDLLNRMERKQWPKK